MKSKILGSLSLLAVVSVMLAPTPAFAVTASGGTVNAFSSVGVGTSAANTDTDSDSASPLPGTLAASTSATQESATAFMGVSAGWTSAQQGNVSVNWGWSLPGGQDLQVMASNPLGTDAWTYSFITGSQGGTFSANWTLDASGANTYGLQGMYGSGSSPFNVTPFNIAPVDGSGNFAVPLLANTSYTFGLFNFGNLSGRASATDASALFTMNWSIEGGGNAVPEPGTLALLGLGLLGLGMSRRRKA